MSAEKNDKTLKCLIHQAEHTEDPATLRAIAAALTDLNVEQAARIEAKAAKCELNRALAKVER